ncbi:MAG: TldD/PmbA family protein [Candidatus Cloacimonetes bacterium]|nr:TldD/PmbA family protein [Candidatus Cloacimonadota bacterium]
MRNLLDSAKDNFDQVETYRIKETSTQMQLQNSALQNIDNSIQSAISLRVIRNQKLGFAYTRNLQSNEDLIKNAENSLLGGVAAGYQFPHSPLVEALESYNPGIEQLNAGVIAEECQRVNNYIKQHTNAETEIYAGKNISSIELMNSHGTNLTHINSTYYLYFSLMYPGSASGISYCLMNMGFREFDKVILDKLIEKYQAGRSVVHPESGAMQVLFTPATMYALTWRISLGISSRSYYDKITPIADKQGVRIFDQKLNFHSDPLDERFPGSRPFDDEGVVCHRHNLIQNGVFEKRYNDLNYASRLNERPTGHGFRASMTSLPAPALHHLQMTPGHDSFEDMVKGMKRGVILESILGAHSGNLPNGDFSIGVAPALYVENGRIIGRLKEGMVSGNIYQILKKVDAVEDTLYATGSSWLPSILVDGVRVDI